MFGASYVTLIFFISFLFGLFGVGVVRFVSVYKKFGFEFESHVAELFLVCLVASSLVHAVFMIFSLHGKEVVKQVGGGVVCLTLCGSLMFLAFFLLGVGVLGDIASVYYVKGGGVASIYIGSSVLGGWVWIVGGLWLCMRSYIGEGAGD
ncbi:hypothetical protein [Pseudomonas sp. Q1-7]|uniref:hypothetical protein n=1 Tax=Pseudomonas sp. Q1-7 TaxID=3020843 RepID=UPI00230073CB|nr:hypothetical protein [Pseudomonas sp. Q1-7]